MIFDNNDDSNKTEEPTGKRLADAHTKGQFAKSQELMLAVMLFAVFSLLLFKGPMYGSQLSMYIRDCFLGLHRDSLTETGAVALARDVILFLSKQLLPLLATCVGSVLLIGGLQSGFQLTMGALNMDIGKVNFWSGALQLFSADKMSQLCVDALKCLMVSWILYGALKNIKNDPIFYMPVPVFYVGHFLWKTFLSLLIRFVIAMGLLGSAHYLYQRYNIHKALKMTRSEVQDENKQAMGNPEMKAAQRRFALKLIRRQMIKAIPTADVVITNPTHYAIALKYERGVDRAPVVLAKGANLFAQKIKAIAKEHDVPTVEDKPTAQLLYKIGIVGKTVPPELYLTVARILAHVYKTHKYYFHRLKARRLETV